MSTPTYVYRLTTSRDLPIEAGTALLNVTPMDASLYDRAEVGPMFTAEPVGFDGVLHLFGDEVARTDYTAEATCRHCQRRIVLVEERWIDPEAGYDVENGDGVWRETCDAHDTFTAEHEPVEP